ncbi:hypothetical protein D3C71_1848810 [compost metagenome]
MNQDVQRFFKRWDVLVVRQGRLSPIDCCHIGAALVVIPCYMNFILRQRIDDVRHALPRVQRITRLRETGDQLAEGFE